MTIRAIACGVALTFCTAGYAAADDMKDKAETFPGISGTLDLELDNDWTINSDDPLNEINDLYGSAALAVRMGIAPWLAINAGLTLEGVLDGAPGENRAFDDVGLYVDTLNAEFAVASFTVTAGKFGPGFGTAWDNTPGVYGTNFAEDYELSEQIGFGVAADLGATPFGTVALGANVFFADTTFLSQSVFTNRGQTRLSDGGVGNTEKLNNFSLTLDGSEVAGVDGLSWHLGYRHLSAGMGDTNAENGFVAGIAHEFETSNSMTVTATGEIAYFTGYGGADDKALYATAGVGVVSGPWHGELAASLRNVNFGAGGSQNDKLVQLSLGYEFENGVDISAAVAHVVDVGEASQYLGLRLTKSLDF